MSNAMTHNPAQIGSYRCGRGQSLLLIERQPGGTVTRRTVLAVRFVPLTDKAGRQQ